MAKENNFHIIGIGASAGGLEALKKFFDNVPSDTPHSFVVVQHLSPDYKSLMAELLAKNTDLPIHQAVDKTKVKSGQVYLIPPKKNMTIRDGELKLTDKPEGQDLNLPIDIFFHSLAQDQGEHAIGIILSGTGSDGTRGGRGIKDAGGIMIVQDPDDAKFDGMPASAIHAGIVDFSLPVEEIPTNLISYIKHQKESGSTASNIEREEETLIRILKHVKNITSKDFLLYKRPTLARRIERRMSICKTKSLKSYLDYIYENPKEVYTLAQEFLICVTKFFRDPEVWENLELKVLTDLVREKGKTLEQLRIWSIGCSSGEEVYTLGMIINEIAAKLQVDVNLKIFATDVEKSYVEKAGKATYSESVVADIHPKLITKYLVCNGDTYTVQENIRKNIIFSQHNILHDPPFNNIDLVLCRNLLIYFKNEAQQKALSVMQYALRLKGHLQLGPSESLGELEQAFSEVDRKCKLFRNEHISRTVNLNTLSFPNSKITPHENFKPALTSSKNVMAESLNELLADELSLAAVYTDKDFNIVHAVGELRQFLELPKSGFSHNLLKILPDNVSAAVNTAIRKSRTEEERILYRDITLRSGDSTTTLDILVSYCDKKTVQVNYENLIVFLPKEKVTNTAQVLDGVSVPQDNSRLVELETELKDTRENLQSTIEEVETTNEELQATNEEMLAANEELQSTNEELQSLNEELHTVNSEYQQKIEDLAELNADIDNLLKSTEIGTIFLDKELKLRKFTPAIKSQFNLRESDTGRPLAHFTSNLSTATSDLLLMTAEEVMHTGEPKNHEVQTLKEEWFLARVNPFKNNKGLIDGAVISFINISEIKEYEQKYLNQNAAFKEVLESALAGYWDWNIPEGKEYLSPTFKRMFGYEEHEMENTPEAWQKIIHPEDLPNVLKNFDEHVSSKGKVPFDQEVRYFHKDGSILWIICRGKVIEWDNDGKPLRMVGSHVDITMLKKIQNRLEKSNEELKQFAYITSHDLQEPLNTVINFSKLLKEDYKGKFDEDADQSLDFISQASERMSHQIKCLLDYSRLGREHDSVTLDPMELIKEIQADLASAISLSKAKIKVAKLPKILAPEYDLRTLFLNLITNAMKFRSKDRTPVISISVKDETDYAVFSVEDNGIGIPQQHQEKIFLIFQRLHNIKEYKGSGIGLANCKKIIENLGGKIWVESKLGEGSCFKFSIEKERVKS